MGSQISFQTQDRGQLRGQLARLIHLQSQSSLCMEAPSLFMLQDSLDSLSSSATLTRLPRSIHMLGHLEFCTILQNGQRLKTGLICLDLLGHLDDRWTPWRCILAQVTADKHFSPIDDLTWEIQSWFMKVGGITRRYLRKHASKSLLLLSSWILSDHLLIPRLRKSVV